MESAQCYLGLGLILGALIGALLAEGAIRHKTAMAKIQALEKEKEKADEIMKKAREKRQQGCSELPGAYLMILLGIIIFVLAVHCNPAGASPWPSS